MIKSYNYQITRFLTSILDINYLPNDNGIEIAFIGRSNTGKSSAINALTNSKNLAKTSKIPGSTKLINLFEVKPGIRLIDLPGYGYAKLPKQIKLKWNFILNEYIKKRNNLKGLVLLIDIRHQIKNLDKKILKLAVNINIPVLILLTKADKLSYRECKIQVNQIRKEMFTYVGNTDIEIFSSLKKQGIDKLQQKLNFWFTNSKNINI